MNKFLLFFLISFSTFGQSSETWKGFKLENLMVDGVSAKIVLPDNADKARNWIWRTQFWGHEPQTDSTLLVKGVAVVYINLEDLYGSQVSMKRMDSFYKFLRKHYKLNRKTVLEGMSRGGLDALNWASKNPKKVASIYVDAPVCDIKSWPGGLGNGKGSKSDWEKCLKIYGLDASTVLDFKDIPIYNAQKIAKAKVPVLSVCGDADSVVPLDENTAILEKTIKENGGIIETIIKKGVEHHPHSLKDPTPIVNFILKYSPRK